MAEYRLTDEAQRDLKQIKKFTEIRFGTRHARAYILKIRRTFEQLAHAPEMGVQSARDGRAKRDQGRLPATPFPLRQPYYLLQRA
ncbi:type II toxin-antitoxin system RelE/ParE family toxin [Cronobacter dublinensis]